MNNHLKLIFLLIIFISINVFALEVDVDEVQKAKKVKFNNYKGRPRKVDPVRGIKTIGYKLADGVRIKGKNKRVRFHLKYSIIHAVSKKEKKKFSADIFSIDKNARVNHIKNIRRMISSYLVRRYAYSDKNARILSFFVTYYNAIYRGDVGYFSKMYKSVVVKHINKRNAGIAINWYEWPGRSKIIIPLTVDAKRGKLDTIDPDVLTDDKVRKELRKDKKNLDKRKDLVEIKEEILDKDKKKFQKEREEAVKEKKELIKDKEDLDVEKKELEKEKEKLKKKEEELKKKKIVLKKIEDPEEIFREEKEIEEIEKELGWERKRITKKEREIKKKERKTRDKDRKITKKERKISREKDRITNKEKSLEKEKKEIAEDEAKYKKDDKVRETIKEKKKRLAEKEKALDKREDELRDKQLDKNIYANKLYYLKINEWMRDGRHRADMFMIDAENYQILFKSPVKNIAGRRYDVFSSGVVVITRKTNDYTSDHNLTLLDRETLAAKKTGSANIFWRSFIEIRGGFIYAIIENDNKYYLGKFDSNLNLVVKSQERVYKDSFISIYGDKIYINKFDMKIVVLKKEDLSVAGEVEKKE